MSRPKVDDFHNFLEAWRANPLHWSNNKRRYNGLPVLRKQLNLKGRRMPPRDVLFHHVLGITEEAVPSAIETVVNQFVSASDMAIWVPKVLNKWEEIWHEDNA